MTLLVIFGGQLFDLGLWFRVESFLIEVIHLFSMILILGITYEKKVLF